MKKTLIFIVCILSLVGCSSVNSILIDQLQPSDVTYPSQIRTVGIVNNIVPDVVYQVSGFDSLSLQSCFCPVDGSRLIKDFSGHLADAEYFDQVIVADVAVYDSLTMKPIPLTVEQADRLISDLNVDMLISFDQSLGAFYYNPKNSIPSSYVSGIGVATVETRLYLPNRNTSFHHFIDRDTLIWTNELSLKDEGIQMEIQDASAYLPLKHLVPRWLQAHRFYFTGRNSSLRDGAVCVDENRWEDACAIWKKAYDTGKGNGKKEAAYNLSVGYEMLDSIMTAKEWLAKAKSMELPKQEKDSQGQVVNPSQTYQMIQYQEKCLNTKERQFISLKGQMSRFDDKK